MTEIEKKVSGMTELTGVTDDDLLYVIQDPLGTPASRKITIANLAASATQRGLVELATEAEAQAGTDTARAVTPAGLAEYMKQPVTIGVNGSVEGSVTLAALESADWHIALDQATWFGNPNDVLIFGYNRTGIGSYDDDSLQSLYMAFEADYYSDETTHSMEWYVEYRGTDGTTRRPYQAAINIDTHVVRNYITGRTDFYSSEGTQNWYLGEDGSINLYRTTGQIYQTINGVGFLRQRNAADTGWVDVAFVNSANQVNVGAPITMWGDILFNHNTNHGPVLIDRTTAANRRIVCDNGVLSTEAA